MKAPTVRRHACGFCLALQRLAIRRRDLALIVAAERLSAEHIAAEAERNAFVASVVMRSRRGMSQSGAQMKVPAEVPIRVIPSKMEVPHERCDA